MPDITGWAIQTTRCAHLDETAGGEVYAINLVMPWSQSEDGTQDSLGASRGPALTGADAYENVGDLLLPWRWKDVSWHVAVHGPAGWTDFASTQPSIPGTEIEGDWPLDALAAEIVSGPASKTRDCPHVYSVRSDDLDIGGDPKVPVTHRSLPHTMAPLTHWPAAASNGALKLAAFIVLPPTDLDHREVDRVVCFPAFSVKSMGHTVTGLVALGNDVVKASYDNAKAIGMCGMSALRTAGVGTDVSTQAAASQGDVSQSGARSLAARVLQPVQMLARGVTQWLADAGAGDAATCKFIADLCSDAGHRDEWTRALLDATGQGFGPSYPGLGGSMTRPHVLEHSIPSAQMDILRTSWATPTVAMMRATLDALTTRHAADTQVTGPSTWSVTMQAWADWCTAPAANMTCDQARHLLSAWLDVARALTDPPVRREFLGPWMAALMVRLPGNDWMDALATQLKTRTFTTADVESCALGRLQSFAPVVLEMVNGPRSSAGGVDDPQAIAQALQQAWQQSLPSLPQAPSIEKSVQTWVDAFDRELRTRTAAATPRPRDPGLTLTFETVTPTDPSQFDRSVRGYAIALCALAPLEGHGWCADQPRAQWITDTAAIVAATKSWVHVPDGASPESEAATCWMHETIGSTLQNGLRVTSIEYDGSPAAAMAADKFGAAIANDPINGDADGSDALDFRWRMRTADDAGGRDLPLLGYGLHYRAEATCIDNAGGVYDSRWRRPGMNSAAELQPARDIFPPYMDDSARAPQWQYRSAVPPGAPTLRGGPPDTAYGFSNETRAQAFELDRRRKMALVAPAGAPGDPEPTPGPVTPLPRVAFMAHDERVGSEPLFADDARHDHSTYTVMLDAPGASAEFVERWLNTDITLLDLESLKGELDVIQGSLSDDVFKTRTAAEVMAYRRALAEQIAPEQKRSTPRLNWHPAVSAIGVAVWIDGATTPWVIHSFELARTRVDGTGALTPGLQRFIKLVVSAAASGAATTTAAANDADGVGTLTINLARGSFARVRSYSLVAPGYFGPNDPQSNRSTDCRYYDGLALTDVPGDVVLPVFPHPKVTEAYKAFGPTELWFEAAPAWQGYAAHPFSLEVVPPGSKLCDDPTPLAPALMALQGQNPAPATWVRSLYVQRHEWHWTGYPVHLPSGVELAQWLASFAGVESYREGFEAPLTTSFDGPGWVFGLGTTGKVVVHRRALQMGARPARYVAFTARVIPRFRAWLNTNVDASLGPLSLQLAVHAAGNVIPGTSTLARDERLSAPPLRWAVPLTATYRYDSAPTATAPVPTAHGNLLVFDTPLRRTDEGARVGGIGDTIEVEVLDAGVTDKDKIVYREIGLNPIFHGNADVNGLDIDVQAPWGLTHDLTTNALVAQTALVVSTSGAAGRWVMAKIRTRRLILPETVLNSELTLLPSATLAERAYSLPTRQEGDEQVPCDFALDGPASSPRFVLRLHVPGEDAAQDRNITWPIVKAGADEAVRFLCSWHKERWQGGGDPTWRLQVLAQTRPKSELAWTTRSKASGYKQGESELPPRFVPDTLALVEQGAATHRPTIVRMSDYTDPLWLTFIGSFGQEVRHAPEDYWLTSTEHGLELMEPPDPEGGLKLTNVFADKSACFQVLLIYRPLADVTRGDARADTGALVAAYVSAGGTTFTGLRFNGGPAATTLSGCAAYLCTVQRITSASEKEKQRMRSVTSFEGLVDLMFPGNLERGDSEALLRLLPEYLGPIEVR